MRLLRNRLSLIPEFGAQIDWGNPLTAGLAEVIVPAQGRTIIGNVPNIGVAHPVTAGRIGRGVAIPNSIATQVQEYAIQSAYQVPLTLIGVFERTQTATGPARLAGSWSNAASGFGFVNNASVRASFARSGLNQILTGGTFSVGRVVVAAYVLDGSTSSVAHTLYEDGLQVATNASAGSIVLGSDAFRVGRTVDASAGWGANHYFYALYRRALSADEIYELCRSDLSILQLFNPGRVVVPGSLAATGSYTLVADGATYAYTAGNAELLFNRRLVADGATYSYSAGDAGLTLGRRLEADGATYAYSAGDANLTVSRVLTADGAAYTYTAGDATLVYTPAGAYTLVADGATYTLTAGDASLRLGRVLQAEGAAYTYTAGDATLTYAAGTTYTLIAEGATYTYSAGDASLRLDRVLQAAGASYAYSAGAATFSYSGAAAPGAAEVWNYELAPGVSAGEMLIAVYTAITTGQVPANVTHIRGIPLIGTGVPGDEFGVGP